MTRGFADGVADGMAANRARAAESNARWAQDDADRAQRRADAADSHAMALTLSLNAWETIARERLAASEGYAAIIKSLFKNCLESLPQAERQALHCAILRDARAHIAKLDTKDLVAQVWRKEGMQWWNNYCRLFPPLPLPPVEPQLGPRPIQPGEVISVMVPRFVFFTAERWQFGDEIFTTREQATKTRDVAHEKYQSELISREAIRVKFGNDRIVQEQKRLEGWGPYLSE